MKQRVTGTGRKGFTLIELLVVVAIIGIIAAILFPVFARARENARRASCMSNVKQIMLGVMMYTQDYDEHFPIIVSTDYPPTGSSTMPWFLRLAPYIKSTQVFQCPSDSNTVKAGVQNAVPADQQIATSYAINIFMSSLGMSTGYPVNVAGASIAQIERPATTVYLTDAGTQSDVRGVSVDTHGSPVLIKSGCALLTSTYSAMTTDPNWCGPNPRHLGTSNVGFADGHVKAMRPQAWYYPAGGVFPWLNPGVGGD